VRPLALVAACGSDDGDETTEPAATDDTVSDETVSDDTEDGATAPPIATQVTLRSPTLWPR
jgi:hypothetical protein